MDRVSTMGMEPQRSATRLQVWTGHKHWEATDWTEPVVRTLERVRQQKEVMRPGSH